MKRLKLRTASQFYGVTIGLTMLVTLLGNFAYRAQVDVLSRSQSMSILSQYGHVEIQGETLMFQQGDSISWFSEELLQALELQSKYYDIHIIE